jgi:CheY-like chemotaxis protein
MTKAKPRILIVEDDSPTAEHLNDCADALGFTVLGITSSGEEAISLARELRPDITLMDIQLSGRMDGIEAAARIRELRIPVVYLTASTDSSTLDRAKITEPFGFVIKPFDRRDLEVAIEMAIYKHKIELERDDLTEQLRQALAEVRTLSGLLPICAYCKKIRDGEGYWGQLEAYITSHSDASFTHGMCPECFNRVKKEIDKIDQTGSPQGSKLAGH